MVVLKSGRYNSRIFIMDRVVNQRVPVEPIVFNIVVDAVVRIFLMEFCGLKEAHHGMVWSVGGPNIVFFVDNVHIAGQNSVWVQKTLTTVLHMFQRVGLNNNLVKTKLIVCTPGFI